MSDELWSLPAHRSEGKASTGDLPGGAEQSSSQRRIAARQELDGEGANRAIIKVTAMRVVVHCPRDRVPDSTSGGEHRPSSLSCSSSRAVWPSIAANASSSAVRLAWSMFGPHR